MDELEHLGCPVCELYAREDWEEERHAFTCDGHPDDLMEPFACGWCGTQVGTNGAQVERSGGTFVWNWKTDEYEMCSSGVFNTPYEPKVPIYLDSSGTAWHTLCALKREGVLK